MEYRQCSFILIFSIFAFTARADCNDQYLDKVAKVITNEKLSIDDEIVKNMPTSVIVAQNVLESSCGSSDVAKEKRNFYGLRGKKGYKKFSSLQESTRYYLENIANHNAYKKTREKISKKEKLSSIIKALAKPYAEDREYAEKLIDVIDSYDLERYDEESNIKIASN